MVRGKVCSSTLFNECRWCELGQDTLTGTALGTIKTESDSKACRDRPECARSICGLAAARVRVEREGVGCAGVCVCVRRKPGAVFVSTEVQGVAEVWQNSEPFVGSIKALL